MSARKWSLGLIIAVFGCGKSEPNAPAVAVGPPALSIPAVPTKNRPAEAVSIRGNESRYSATFEQATLSILPEGQHRPVERTVSNQSTPKLRSDVERLWPTIALIDADGFTIPYRLSLDTDLGLVTLVLRPELAPNHVRNLIALTQAGYYDGLAFDRLVRQEAEVDGRKIRVDVVKAGCPLGLGEEGVGHLGYFLKAEFSPDRKHVAGTIGMIHEDDPDSAGVRFYITVGPVPAMDGSFSVCGDVVTGLETVQKIHAAPTLSPTEYPEVEKPVQAVRIRKATVQPITLP